MSPETDVSERRCFPHVTDVLGGKEGAKVMDFAGREVCFIRGVEGVQEH